MTHKKGDITDVFGKKNMKDPIRKEATKDKSAISHQRVQNIADTQQDLVASGARREHRALFYEVKIQPVFVKLWIVTVANVGIRLGSVVRVKG